MLFKSRTYGVNTVEQAMRNIADHIKSRPGNEWVLAIGTDSQNRENYTKYCHVIMLVQKGKGGIFFHSVHREPRVKVVVERMMEEARMSIELTKSVLNELEEMFYEEYFDFTSEKLGIEIHCDMGYEGKSRDAIASAIGWITMEFAGEVTAVIKPDSAAASSIADSFTK